jgi:hypothetical protein
MFFSVDLARMCFWTAYHLGGTRLAGALQSLILGDALAAGTAIGVRIVSTELFERLTLGANLLVVLWVSLTVGAAPCAVNSALRIKH